MNKNEPGVIVYNHKIPIHHKQARHFANWIALLRDQNKRLDLETKELRKAVCELQKGLQSIIADTKQSQIWKEKEDIKIINWIKNKKEV